MSKYRNMMVAAGLGALLAAGGCGRQSGRDQNQAAMHANTEAEAETSENTLETLDALTEKEAAKVTADNLQRPYVGAIAANFTPTTEKPYSTSVRFDKGLFSYDVMAGKGSKSGLPIIEVDVGESNAAFEKRFNDIIRQNPSLAQYPQETDSASMPWYTIRDTHGLKGSKGPNGALGQGDTIHIGYSFETPFTEDQVGKTIEFSQLNPEQQKEAATLYIVGVTKGYNMLK